jgi:hypothetical protein
MTTARLQTQRAGLDTQAGPLCWGGDIVLCYICINPRSFSRQSVERSLSVGLHLFFDHLSNRLGDCCKSLNAKAQRRRVSRRFFFASPRLPLGVPLGCVETFAASCCVW